MSTVGTNTDSAIAQELVCQRCNTKLVTNFISASQSADVVIRCGNCGEVWSPLQGEIGVDKNAWRSLWLGLVSPLLICFTGIPALYFGIKSLLRTRYTRTRPRDRRAAIVGTIMGGLFGVFGSLCVFGIGGTVLAMFLSNVNASNFEQTSHILDGIVEVQLPDEIIDGRATKMLGASILRFGDEKEKNKGDVRFDIQYFPPSMAGSVTTLNGQLRDKELARASYRKLEEEQLQWQLCGKRIVVTKLVREETDDEKTSEVHHYYGYSSIESGVFAFAFLHRLPESGFDEARIRGFVESITPKQNIDVDQRWRELSKMVSTEPKSQGVRDEDEPNDVTAGQETAGGNDQ